ncbi:glucosamine-6-phosphate deaminase [Escherichia coli]|nr:glucosamine-6-phosphate deaminase [Escherichia coli]
MTGSDERKPPQKHPADAPRDKCAHFREINGIAAAFQYLQKNYIPTALSFH